MSSEERDNHFVMITKTSFYNGNLMETSWHVSKHAISRFTGGNFSLLLNYLMQKYSKDFASSCCNFLLYQITHEDEVTIFICNLIQRNRQFTKKLMFVTILWSSVRGVFRVLSFKIY